MGKVRVDARGKQSGFSVQSVIRNNQISYSEIETISRINYPLFSFRYLSKSSIEDCKDTSFLFDFIMRLKKLSELGWNEIRKSHRHAYGMEKLPIYKIKEKLPSLITSDVEELSVFRAAGNNLPFIGIQQGKIFHILFIEARFGDIYGH